MKTNYHTHSTWCDGKDSPETLVLAAIEKNFDEIGFSSHSMLPADLFDWTVTRAKFPSYLCEIRSLAAKYSGRIKVLCGIEADFIPGTSFPDRKYYPGVDYIIGSVHFVKAPDGALTCVDKSPESFERDIREHYSGSAEAFVRAYFAAEREMVASCDFDIVGHPDLVRKFNSGARFFDETSSWYKEEISRTADAIAASGKNVEINTGAISRGWMDDAYPSKELLGLLKARNVPLILSSDAHSADALDCAFERFQSRIHDSRFTPIKQSDKPSTKEEA